MSNELIDEMYEAIYDRDCEKIDALVHAGLGVGTRVEGDNWNFLHMALVSVTLPPDPNVIQHLICIGVDVNARDRSRWTPLHFAVRGRNASIVRMLLQAGAEVDPLNDEGVTPLHQCLLEIPWNLEAAELLLAAGANPDRDRDSGSVRNFANVVANPDRNAFISLLDRYTKA